MAEKGTQLHEAYNAFLLRHRETLWHTCWQFAQHDRIRCENMVQEVWIALWLRFDQLDASKSEYEQRAWLKRVTRSVLVDLYRRTDPEPERLTPALINTLPDTYVNYAESIGDLLAILPDDERRLMKMRLDGFDAQSIADELGIQRNAVYVRVNRIITKLRKRHGTGL